MHYFIGSLYGNYDNYLSIKKHLKLKPHDELWILGDCFDGNDENPEDCINIVYDIMNSSNVHLVLGDHEYNHIMYYVSVYNKTSHEGWEERIHNMDIPGSSLLYYIFQNLSQEEQDDLFCFLIQECEISNLIPIGDNYFYLVHGFPSMFQNDLTRWQLSTTEGEPPEQFIDFLPMIQSDPSLTPLWKEKNIKLQKDHTFVICSHKYSNENQITFENQIFLLDENKPDEYIHVLGIDAAGWFIQKINY